MNLHEEFYDFRTRVWESLEALVHKGCDTIGEFPISIGEIHVEPKGLRTITTCFADQYDLVIHGIIANPNYSIHPPKESEKDINIITNKIQVKVRSYILKKDEIIEIEPYVLDLQTLSTYISGGFSLYT